MSLKRMHLSQFKLLILNSTSSDNASVVMVPFDALVQHFGQLSEDLVVEPSSIPWESASLHPLKVCWRLALGCSSIPHSQTTGKGSEYKEACAMWRGWGSTAFPVGSSRYAQLMFRMIVPPPGWPASLSATTSSSLSLSLHLAQNRGTSPHPGLLFLPGILLDSNLVMFKMDWSASVWAFYLQPEVEACSLQSACLNSRKIWSCIKMYTYLYR